MSLFNDEFLRRQTEEADFQSVLPDSGIWPVHYYARGLHISDQAFRQWCDRAGVPYVAMPGKHSWVKAQDVIDAFERERESILMARKADGKKTRPK